MKIIREIVSFSSYIETDSTARVKKFVHSKGQWHSVGGGRLTFKTSLFDHYLRCEWVKKKWTIAVQLGK